MRRTSSAQIIETLAQCGQVHLDDREAVIQIAAEAAAADLVPEIVVRRGHDAHVVALAALRAERRDLAGLEQPQQLRL